MLDGTGPMGMGPMTGRGLGPCNGGTRRGFEGRMGRAGRGFGRGVGYGMRFYSEKNEISALEEEEKILKQELEAIKNEKDALNKQAK